MAWVRQSTRPAGYTAASNNADSRKSSISSLPAPPLQKWLVTISSKWAVFLENLTQKLDSDSWLPSCQQELQTVRTKKQWHALRCNTCDKKKLYIQDKESCSINQILLLYLCTNNGTWLLLLPAKWMQRTLKRKKREVRNKMCFDVQTYNGKDLDLTSKSSWPPLTVVFIEFNIYIYIYIYINKFMWQWSVQH